MRKHPMKKYHPMDDLIYTIHYGMNGQTELNPSSITVQFIEILERKFRAITKPNLTI